MGLIYLASPYAHKDQEVMDQRSLAVRKMAASLMVDGRVVFSPIAHGTALKEFMPERLQVNHRFWLRQDAAYLFSMSELYVLRLPGWDESKGVAWEILTAEVLGVPVHYIDPLTH